MKFLDRLFPFLDKEIFVENMLTAYWVIALVAIFLIAFFYLVWKLFLIKRSLKSNRIKTHKKMRRIWTAYQSSFYKYGESIKTTEFAENYFNEQNILLASLNLRLINNISNILIGLGILGTFVGLTYGIADSNFETTEAIKESINNLLSGMGTAFVSSIWGMFLSLVFTIIFKLWQSNMTKQIQDLCLDLDMENKIEQQNLKSINSKNNVISSTDYLMIT